MSGTTLYPTANRKGRAMDHLVDLQTYPIDRPDSPAYAASKWGLDGLTRSLAIIVGMLVAVPYLLIIAVE